MKVKVSSVVIVVKTSRNLNSFMTIGWKDTISVKVVWDLDPECSIAVMSVE